MRCRRADLLNASCKGGCLNDHNPSACLAGAACPRGEMGHGAAAGADGGGGLLAGVCHRGHQICLLPLHVSAHRAGGNGVWRRGRGGHRAVGRHHARALYAHRCADRRSPGDPQLALPHRFFHLDRLSRRRVQRPCLFPAAARQLAAAP